MGSISNPFGGEGTSINRPPLFNGEGYAYWKVRMKIFIQAIDMEIWNAIENGPFVPQTKVNDVVSIKPQSSWDNDDKKKVAFDLKAKNIITSALSYDEFFRVSQCVDAKQMWDTLQVTHEGTSEVRRARLNTLMHEYELFRMLPNENIGDMQKRFTHIINHLSALGKVITNGEVVNKILRCLSREWQPKVTAIMEARDVDQIDLATLFGKLQEHEMELGRLSMNEDADRKKKGIALKSTSKSLKAQEDNSQVDNSDSDIDDETFGLLVKKLGRFLKKKGNFNRNRQRDSKDSQPRNKTNKDHIKCHGCGKLGHYRSTCPTNSKKSEGDNSKFNSSKGKRAYIVWDEVESQSTSSSSDDEELANLCLMTKLDEEESSSIKSSENVNEVDYLSDASSSSNSPSFNELYNVYVEMHKELKKLAKINVERKNFIMKQHEKIIELQKDLEELKLQNETLELIYANSTCNCELKSNETPSCENCKSLEKEVFNLNDRLARLMKGDTSLDHLLSTQRNNSNRSGLGYTKPKKRNYRKVGGFSKNKISKNPTCHYCGIFGHTTNKCNIKKFGIPSGEYIWIVKGTSPHANNKGPKTTWVPKSTK